MNIYDVKHDKSKKWTTIIILAFLISIFFSNFNFSKNAYPVSGYNNLKVIPSGNTIGVKLYVQGVLVVGKSDVVGTDGKIYKPVNESNIKQGDRIIKVNDVEINNSTQLIEYISNYQTSELKIEYIREGKNYIETITPILSNEDGKYRLGIWVKDGAIGIGTQTFYEPISKTFGAIGHGITDIDTGELLEINDGDLLQAKVIDITKGKRTIPGELKGMFDENTKLGKVLLNSKKGIYGKYDEIQTIDKYKDGIYIADRNEVKVGNATILCNIDNEIKEYNISIEKIYKVDNNANKNIVIKIIDEDLINKTGGIVQGMSGSPIIQDNKLIGAVTHVFLNDPTRGYAVFIDNMIENIKEIK